MTEHSKFADTLSAARRTNCTHRHTHTHTYTNTDTQTHRETYKVISSRRADGDVVVVCLACK